jgi:hypothetical protein
MAGQSLGLGSLVNVNPGGKSDRPVSMIMCPSVCEFDQCPSDRTSAQCRLRAARPGRCSQISMPELAVEIGLNSPRISAGARGFRSKLSCCARPPERKI